MENRNWPSYALRPARPRWSVYFSFFDDSGTWNGDFSILAGFVADGAQLDALTEPWGAALMRRGLREFKAHQWATNPEVTNAFMDIGKPAIMLGFGVAVDAGYFKRMPQKPMGALGCASKDVHSFLFQRVLRRWRDRMPAGSSNVVYFDSSEDAGPEFHRLWIKLRSEDAELRNMLHTVAFADSRMNPPLQLADLVANSMLRHLRAVAEGGEMPEASRRLLAPGQDELHAEWITEYWSEKGLNDALRERRAVAEAD